MARDDSITLGAEEERALAMALFNHTWSLLDLDSRTQEQDDEMLHAAHASGFHWGRVGRPVNRVRAEWQCSRVYAVLGRAEPALHHARRSLELCRVHGDELEEFDLPFAHEALARAQLTAGDPAAAREELERARALAAQIEDVDDRELVEADLARLEADARA